MKKLFDYQQAIVNEVLQKSQHSKSVLTISLMGTGKTVMTAWLVNEMVQQGKRCLLIVDLTCLLNMIAEELWEWKIPFGFIKAGKPYDSTLPVAIASAQTIDARINGRKRKGSKEEVEKINIDDYLGHYDYIILDEAHNLSYRKIIEDLRSHYKNSTFWGMTATPWRLNPDEYLGQHYQEKVEGLQPPDLVKKGLAVPCRIFHYKKFFNLDTIAKGQDGDFSDTDMEEQSISTKKLNEVFTEWQEKTPGHTTIAYCSTVKHAIALSDYFNKQGVKSDFIHADVKECDREILYKKLESGEITMLASVRTISAGFNCKPVTCIMVITVTRSKALYHQMGGRGGRIYPGKEFYYILDFGNNCKGQKHGSPMSYQDYSIDHKGGKQDLKRKLCPNCDNWISIFARICPECDHVFEKKEKPDEESAELPKQEELDMHIPMVEFFSDEDRTRLRWFREFRAKCYQEKMSPVIADTRFFEIYGYRPPADWAYQAILGAEPTVEEIAAFRTYLRAFFTDDCLLYLEFKKEVGDRTFGKKKSAKKKTRRNSEPIKFTKPPRREWFQVLGCDRYTTYENVKLAYREQARKWHPDVCRDAIADVRMKEINNAWDEYCNFYQVSV